ncbi:hypothetical protein Bca52824_027745 [Brassica carinata]|uniref:Uncharacterized protein n=1 Tax=Brassica carinata TaxID=52824 RepID=A0A8X7VB09_BRACI|nr:hypothetical protein Bca52824_027745 [Brassica carinata]
MIFHIMILVSIALCSRGRLCSSHQPPTNQSNPNPSFPVNQMGSQLLVHSTAPSQSNQTSSSPAYPTQPGHPLNPILPFTVRVPPPNPARTKHSELPESSVSYEDYLNSRLSSVSSSFSVAGSTMSERNPTVQSPMIQQLFHWSDPPSQNNLTLPFTMFQQLFHWSNLLSQRNLTLPCPMIQQRFQWSDPPSQSIQTLPFPMFQLVFQSAAHSLPPPSPSIRISASRGQLPHEFHTMDRLSLCVLNYFFAGGPSYTSTWSQRPNLSTSIHIQCFLNQAAFSLFLLANAVFPRTRPILAFVLDRFSFFLIVISANMPMFPP